MTFFIFCFLFLVFCFLFVCVEFKNRGSGDLCKESKNCIIRDLREDEMLARKKWRKFCDSYDTASIPATCGTFNKIS
jgi:hypothetical protein